MMEGDPVERVLRSMGFVQIATVERPADVDPVGLIREVLGAAKSTRVVYEFAVRHSDLDLMPVSLRIGSTTVPAKRARQYADPLSRAMSDPQWFAPLWAAFADQLGRSDYFSVTTYEQKPWRPKKSGGVDALRLAERVAHATRTVQSGRAPALTGVSSVWRDGEHDAMREALRGEAA